MCPTNLLPYICFGLEMIFIKKYLHIFVVLLASEITIVHFARSHVVTLFWPTFPKDFDKHEISGFFGSYQLS